MKTKTVTQEALAAAKALHAIALRTQKEAKMAYDLTRSQTAAAKESVARLSATVEAERIMAKAAREGLKAQRIAAKEAREAARADKAAAKAERQAKAQARREAAVAKAEARLAKAKERALNPVGIKKAQADRKPSAVTVIKPATVAA